MPQRRSSARRSFSLALARSTPNTSIEPSRRGKSPMMVRNSTDLPAPEAPTTPRISPARRSRERWSSTIWSPKPTTRSRTLMTGPFAILLHPDRGEEDREQAVEHDHEEDRLDH